MTFWAIVLAVVAVLLLLAWRLDRKRPGTRTGRVGVDETQRAHLHADLHDRGQFGQPGPG